MSGFAGKLTSVGGFGLKAISAIRSKPPSRNLNKAGSGSRGVSG
jgi:hypothetical protein